MKRRKRLQKKENRIAKKGAGPIPVFLITLCIVLAAGFAVIFYLSLKDGSETMAGQTEEIGFHFFWEKIPEVEGEITPAPETDSRYGSILADEAYMRENNMASWESSDEKTVTFGFTGDILLDDEYAVMANLLNRGGTIENGISEEMLAQLRGSDILVVNNEFPFTDGGTPTEGKTYTFRADTDTVSYLQDMGADVAVLANNHIYDFGETGLLDTLDTLDQAGILRTGAGRNLEEASKPLYFIVNDQKIALVSATQIERLDNPDTKGATESSPGVFRCWNPEKLYEVVRQAGENSDFVIVYIHWGTENVTEPDWAQLEQAKGLEEAGADLIVGDHPHCLQGIEYVNDTPVIYSLGNFWFNSKTVDTGMVKATLGENGLESLQLLPAIQSDCRVDLAYGTDKERILSYMRTLSPDVQIDEEGFISNHQ